ncbi:type II toxin-antitoxin system YafQ family toxin [bacterium]|nr:type II toxin-antitoxin system YafQ family toxin [bacterium]
MLEVYYTTKFKKDIKLLKKRGYRIDKLKEVIELLMQQKELSAKYKNHSLNGIYNNYQECHIEPDWLLIYKIEKEILTLILTRTGTHSDLF